MRGLGLVVTPVADVFPSFVEYPTRPESPWNTGVQYWMLFPWRRLNVASALPFTRPLCVAVPGTLKPGLVVTASSKVLNPRSGVTKSTGYLYGVSQLP